MARSKSSNQALFQAYCFTVAGIHITFLSLTSVGAIVGSNVGGSVIRVGENVGTTVGGDVGATEGIRVGRLLGALVPRPRSKNFPQLKKKKKKKRGVRRIHVIDYLIS